MIEHQRHPVLKSSSNSRHQGTTPETTSVSVLRSTSAWTDFETNLDLLGEGSTESLPSVWPTLTINFRGQGGTIGRDVLTNLREYRTVGSKVFLFVRFYGSVFDFKENIGSGFSMETVQMTWDNQYVQDNLLPLIPCRTYSFPVLVTSVEPPTDSVVSGVTIVSLGNLYLDRLISPLPLLCDTYLLNSSYHHFRTFSYLLFRR